MKLNELLSQIGVRVKQVQYELFLIVCIALIALTSYQMGKLASRGKLPLTIGEDAAIFRAAQGQETAAQATAAPRDPRVVVSKASDSKKYHFTWCSGAQRIKEENKLWFANETLAQQVGYTLADNCQ
ncbi:MAG: hypothetical protein AAB864_00410 [Patescibacteria group bacterium]